VQQHSTIKDTAKITSTQIVIALGITPCEFQTIGTDMVMMLHDVHPHGKRNAKAYRTSQSGVLDEVSNLHIVREGMRCNNRICEELDRTMYQAFDQHFQ
jgi:hypothetical protein